MMSCMTPAAFLAILAAAEGAASHLSAGPMWMTGTVGARRTTTILTRPRRQTLVASGHRRGATTRGASLGIGAAHDAGHTTIDLLMSGPFEQNVWPANAQVDSCC